MIFPQVLITISFITLIVIIIIINLTNHRFNKPKRKKRESLEVFFQRAFSETSFLLRDKTFGYLSRCYVTGMTNDLLIGTNKKKDFSQKLK